MDVRRREAILARNNVQVRGRGVRPMLFAHGFGCDQNMWRLVAPAFDDAWKVVLYDHVGSGRSDLRAYDREKYASLQGYADDALEICRALDLDHVVFVGHSVSAMIGLLAAVAEPARFASVVMVGPSPCYVDEPGYEGGFTRSDIESLLVSLESNYLGWSTAMAPAIMGNPDRPALGSELAESFCRMDPDIAKAFARVTFLSDHRKDVPRLQVPALVLQCSEDVIAPSAVGEWLRRELPRAELVLMKATGHCPNLSAPEETIAAMRAFLERRPR